MITIGLCTFYTKGKWYLFHHFRRPPPPLRYVIINPLTRTHAHMHSMYIYKHMYILIYIMITGFIFHK